MNPERALPRSGALSDSEPFYPILHIDELGPLHDYREALPLHTQAELDIHDMVVHIVTPEIRQPTLKPSTIREMLRLTNVQHTTQIGDNGPAVAGLSSSENQAVAALRKFEIVHGRDGLEIGFKLRDHHPKLLPATIIALAESQGLEQEVFQPGKPFRQEEIGRVMLLDRSGDDPIGKKFSDRMNWGQPFYGSVDATPSFVNAIAYHTLNHDPAFLSKTYTARDGVEYTIADALDRSVGWVLRKLNETQDGLLEFKNTDPVGGMSAQAWKDSAFAYLHADGKRANYADGIASVEVQALAYDALMNSAQLYAQSDPERATLLQQRAAKLRQQIFDQFWIDDPEKGEFFALATDRAKDGSLQPLKVRSSNMGHLLNSTLLEGDDPKLDHMRRSVTLQLFSPELLHASGVRTLASDEAGFRPGGYHTGSVWLWDSAYIADGLERHNYHYLAWELRTRLWQTVQQTGTFPEFVRSSHNDTIEFNDKEIYVWNSEHEVLHLFEQPHQEIQGWTVSALLAAKRDYTRLNGNLEFPTSEFEQAILASISGPNPH